MHDFYYIRVDFKHGYNNIFYEQKFRVLYNEKNKKKNSQD